MSSPHSSRHPPVYDRIGVDYDLGRRSDPIIFSRIAEALCHCETVINVGAGTGSYEPANCTLAVEPSARMIAQRPAGTAKCLQAVAEKLPVADQSFDGALASLTIHHWTDVLAGLAELRRVTRKRIVLFTWDPEFPINFWLTRDYLPAVLALDRPRFPTLSQLEKALSGIEIQSVPIPANCQDGFIGAYWKRPEFFLDPQVQRTNSALIQLDPAILNEAMERLRRDLETGAWHLKNADLEELDSLDLGYRLIISDIQ